MTKKQKEAIKTLDKAIELNPQSPEAYSYRGYIKLETEQYEEAVEDLTKAIEFSHLINKEDESLRCSYLAEIYTNRGFGKVKLGQHEEALMDFNKALEIDPESEVAQDNRDFSLKIVNELIEIAEDLLSDKDLLDESGKKFMKGELKVLKDVRDSTKKEGKYVQ